MDSSEIMFGRGMDRKAIWACIFKTIDSDLDGYITPDDLSVYMSTYARVSEDEVNDIYKLVSDKEKGMSLEEFYDFTKDIRLTRRSVMMMWDAMDFDCDGIVTVTEFAREMTSLTSDQEVEQIFEHFDVNGDAELSKEEFLRYFGVNEIHKNAKKIKLAPIHAETLENFKKGIMKLHWSKKKKRPGIGKWLMKADHIAITVEDVERSVRFYRDILGLQPINRPDFDRAGAWFTVGNVELHLIKGPPCVPTRGHLICPHLAIEVTDTEAVHKWLLEHDVEFEINVSVPKGVGEGSVTQLFLVDPDGYRVEMCNCGEVLEDYCLSDQQDSKLHLTYFEGSPAKAKIEKLLELDFIRQGLPLESNIKATSPVESTHEEILGNLLKRRKVYGDVTQVFTEQEIDDILTKNNDSADLALKEMRARRAQLKQEDVYIPPDFYGKNVSSDERINTPRLHLSKKDS